MNLDEIRKDIDELVLCGFDCVQLKNIEKSGEDYFYIVKSIKYGIYSIPVDNGYIRLKGNIPEGQYKILKERFNRVLELKW